MNGMLPFGVTPAQIRSQMVWPSSCGSVQEQVHQQVSMSICRRVRRLPRMSGCSVLQRVHRVAPVSSILGWQTGAQKSCASAAKIEGGVALKIAGLSVTDELSTALAMRMPLEACSGDQSVLVIRSSPRSSPAPAPARGAAIQFHLHWMPRPLRLDGNPGNSRSAGWNSPVRCASSRRQQPAAIRPDAPRRQTDRQHAPSKAFESSSRCRGTLL